MFGEDASTFHPQTFQEWPPVKQEYGRKTGVLFGLKVIQKARNSLRSFFESRLMLWKMELAS